MPRQDIEQVLATLRDADPGKRIPPGVRPADEPVARPVADVIHPTGMPDRTRHFRTLLSAAAVVTVITGLAIFLAVDHGRPEAAGSRPPVPTTSPQEHGTSRHSAEQLVHRVIAAVPQPADHVLVEGPGTGKIARPSETLPHRHIAHAVVYGVSQRPAAAVIGFFDRAVPVAPIAGLRFDATSSTGSSDGVFGSGFIAATSSRNNVHMTVDVARTAQGATYRVDVWTRWTTMSQSRGRSR